MGPCKARLVYPSLDEDQHSATLAIVIGEIETGPHQPAMLAALSLPQEIR
ncbi:hypothetical protein HALA3H3_910110 [Halomonas sp. A3H3]|nr:conserved hypothetical protein [Halomonas sp. 156]CAD5287282.1 conserved hypothetical protein [Halomonas sp. 113]CAD5288806.1 conserved hypothetical protein [Halomonas sp. 59]CAD5291791.1 conserved hypothetical protein [Halomonas sp. I3]CDG55625.1 hypothetical protein HALA3H3_910110 [Halomonas sp. A3H3]VXB40855.1 conserved hypothetical protein [Halomonas titanicae]